MNSIIKSAAILVLLFTIKGNAQEFQGVATYKTKRSMEIKFDSTKVSSDMQEKMIEMMKKQFEKTYVLQFDKEQSNYKEEESLGAPNPTGGQILMLSSNGSDVLYKNIKESRYTNQNDLFGKIFLISDSLAKPKWTMHSETKNIGEYTCFKATMEKEIEARELSLEKDGPKEPEVTKKTIIITAWYTPQIPVSHGPGMFHGLPGLILEVNNDKETILCSKIVLNPSPEIQIEKPTKGKEVNQKEYNKIMQEKIDEMNERYKSNRPDKNDIHISIKG